MIGRTISALDDGTRREILKLLRRGERSVGDIAERFDVSVPAISRHLAILRDAGLVTARREGKSVIYCYSPEPLSELREWLREMEREE
ncbi:MAG: ArsR/SmtB family transcription factor [Eubacteriales bacterium]